jgi:hypothetical protein
MSKSQNDLTGATINAISGRIPPLDSFPLVVAPTDKDSEHNTIRPAIFPLACFKLEDVTFDFDSSFIMPGLRPAMAALKDLLDEHPNSPMSIFGHADPVGNDDYNKGLSGRRAQAFFALLSRRIDLWEDLHTHEPKGWGDRSVQLMLDALGFNPGRTDGTVDQPTKDAIKAFQSAEGLGSDGIAGPNTRKKLYEKYMDFLCVDSAATPYQLEKSAFLGRGADAGGKADFQGCSEFNPLLLFSKEEKRVFDADQDKGPRNAENAPNRRVMVLLFRPGTTVDVSKWPCPRAKEGTAGCRKRFWSDGEKRRQNTDDRREFKDTRDTFACRFYQRLSDNSPCERAGALAAFRYSIQIAAELPWTDKASIRFTSEDGKHVVVLAAKDAVGTDTARTFAFVNFRLGVKYRAELIEDKLALGLFGLADLSEIQDPKGSANHVPLSPPSGAAPPEGRGGTEIPVPPAAFASTKNVPATDLTKDI